MYTHTYVICTGYARDTPVIRLRYACDTPVIRLWYACDTPVIRLWYTCDSHVVFSPSVCVCVFFCTPCQNLIDMICFPMRYSENVFSFAGFLQQIKESNTHVSPRHVLSPVSLQLGSLRSNHPTFALGSYVPMHPHVNLDLSKFWQPKFGYWNFLYCNQKSLKIGSNGSLLGPEPGVAQLLGIPHLPYSWPPPQRPFDRGGSLPKSSHLWKWAPVGRRLRQAWTKLGWSGSTHGLGTSAHAPLSSPSKRSAQLSGVPGCRCASWQKLCRPWSALPLPLPLLCPAVPSNPHSGTGTGLEVKVSPLHPWSISPIDFEKVVYLFRKYDKYDYDKFEPW